MDLYEVSFFSNDNGPKVSVKCDSDHRLWPISVTLNSSGLPHNTPRVLIYITHKEWIAFKNSILQADREIVRELQNG